ncbi:hypothetical protein [Pseudoalteromonas xiamenensis]
MKNTFRLSSIASVVALAFSLNVTAAESAVSPVQHDVYLDNQEMSTMVVDPVTTSIVASWLLDQAKGAIASQAKSFIKNLLFGSGESTGPAIVRLHEEDLQKIENMITDVIITDAVYDAKSQLNGFGTTFEYYQDSLNSGRFDSAILSSLLNYVNTLRYHRAYDLGYNSNAYALTTSYSLMASLNVTVLTERYVNGYVSQSFVRSQAKAMASTLSSLGAAVDSKASKMGYVRTFGNGCWGTLSQDKEMHQMDVEAEQTFSIEGREVQPMAPQGCIVQALFPGKPYKTWDAEILGRLEAEELAYDYLTTVRTQYANEIKGENYSQILTKLNSL